MSPPTTSLQKEFLRKITRTLYRYAKDRGRTVIDKGGIFIHHDDAHLVVNHGDLTVCYVQNGRAEWAANQVINACMAEIDRIFILDDLADL
ncbi:MAG: hypothetical protein AB7L09_01780 [Nitrospira sp.]